MNEVLGAGLWAPQRPGAVARSGAERLRRLRLSVVTFTLLATGAGCAAPDTLTPVEDALGDEVLDAARPALARALVVNGLLAETCGLVDLEGYVFAGAPARALGITSVTVTRDDSTGAVRWAFGDVGVDGALGALGVVTDTSRQGLEVEWVGEGWILSGTLTERCTDAGAALNGTLALQEGGRRDSVAFSGEAPLAGLAWELPPRATPFAGAARWSRQEDTRSLVLDDASAIDGTTWPGEARGTGWTAEVGWDVGFLSGE